MKQILEFKAWQTFMLIIVPFILMSMISEIMGTITFIIIFFGWIYYLGLNLYKKNNKKNEIKFQRFKLNLVITFCLFVFTNVLPDEFLDFNFYFENYEWLSYGIAGVFVIFIISAFVSWIKLYIFISDNVNEIEKRKTWAFWQLIFFPFGIWYLQPIIKNIFSQNEEVEFSA